MAGELQTVSRQYESDFGDSLPPGYIFSPTNLEIIGYLKHKINGTGEPPKCRFHDVDLYECHPKVLTDKHRQSDLGYWYFFTSRERQYRNGNRPNRRTRDGLGWWKAGQAQKVVYDENKQAVGNNRLLTYNEGKKNKTSWLMHEFTTILPNLPVESNRNVLTEWVLCKVYNTDKNYQTSHQAGQVRKRIQEDVNEEQNQVHGDEPSPRRRRLSVNQETNQTNEPNYVQIGEKDQKNESDHVQTGEKDPTNEPDDVQIWGKDQTNEPDDVRIGGKDQTNEPDDVRIGGKYQTTELNHIQIGEEDQTNEPDHLQIQETNNHSGSDVQIVEPVDNNNAQDIWFPEMELNQIFGINHYVHDPSIGGTNLESNYMQPSLHEALIPNNQVLARDQRLLEAPNYQVFARDQQLLEAPACQRSESDQQLLKALNVYNQTSAREQHELEAPNQRFARDQQVVHEPWNYYGNSTPLPSTSYGFRDDPTLVPLTYDEDQTNYNQVTLSIDKIGLDEIPTPPVLMQNWAASMNLLAVLSEYTVI